MDNSIITLQAQYGKHKYITKKENAAHLRAGG